MRYEKDVPFVGSSARALELAQSMLVQSGYRITHVSESRVTGEHAGGLIRTQSGQAIYGASPITVVVHEGRLRVTAGYGGVDRTRTFLLRFLPGLAVFLGLALGAAFALAFDEVRPVILGVSLGVGIPLIQLPIHLGVTVRIMRSRATFALDTLVGNLVTLSRG